MNASVKPVADICTALREAMARQDWPAISQLDLQCRQLMADILQDPPADRVQLCHYLNELLMLYRLLVTACREEQRRVAGELTQIRQSRDSARMYRSCG